MPTRCAVGGGISLGVGTLANALFSPSTAGCSTNLVVLTHATVTARGCAASSFVAHIGVGLMVLGAVLLLGSFILIVRSRRQPPVDVSAAAAQAPEARDAVPTPSTEQVGPTGGQRQGGAEDPHGPVAPGADGAPRERPVVDVPSAVEPAAAVTTALPPGWYGNPETPGKPVQWWDGSRLTDRPPRPRR